MTVIGTSVPHKMTYWAACNGEVNLAKAVNKDPVSDFNWKTVPRRHDIIAETRRSCCYLN